MTVFNFTVFYVADVTETVGFYENAFGLQRKFIHESGQYAEMDTGGVALAFCADDMAASLFTQPYRKNNKDDLPIGCQISLMVDNVAQAYRTACAAGATPITPPTVKPWGFIIAFVRDCNGILVELCKRA